MKDEPLHESQHTGRKAGGSGHGRALLQHADWGRAIGVERGETLGIGARPPGGERSAQMDGFHRLIKAWPLEHETIRVVRFSELPEPDERKPVESNRSESK
jgi:hypothetical protein